MQNGCAILQSSYSDVQDRIRIVQPALSQGEHALMKL